MWEISKNFCMREGDKISLQNVGVSRKMTGLVNVLNLAKFQGNKCLGQSRFLR